MHTALPMVTNESVLMQEYSPPNLLRWLSFKMSFINNSPVHRNYSLSSAFDCWLWFHCFLSSSFTTLDVIVKVLWLVMRSIHSGTRGYINFINLFLVLLPTLDAQRSTWMVKFKYSSNSWHVMHYFITSWYTWMWHMKNVNPTRGSSTEIKAIGNASIKSLPNIALILYANSWNKTGHGAYKWI